MYENHQTLEEVAGSEIHPDATAVLMLRLASPRSHGQQQHDQKSQQGSIPRTSQQRGIAPTRTIDRPADLITKLANHISSRPVFAHQVPALGAAETTPASYSKCVLPHELREMACVLSESWIIIVVVFDLICP